MAYIKLSRKLTTNDIWESKPFDKGHAWVDLLLLANHEDKSFVVGNTQINGKKGCVYRSKHWLADRWGWSVKKVTSYLNFLQSLDMITVNSIRLGSVNGTVITIEKYEVYQTEGMTKGTVKESSRKVEGKLKETIQQHKEEHKEEHKEYISPSADFESDDDEGWEEPEEFMKGLKPFEPNKKRKE